MSDAQFEQLCHAYCDDRLTPDEAVALDALVTGDDALAAVFVRMVMLQSALERSERPNIQTTPLSALPASPAPTNRRRIPLLLSLAAAFLLTAAAVAIYYSALAPSPSTLAPAPSPVATLIDVSGGGEVFVNDNLAAPGSEYAAGTYSTDSGVAEFLLTNRVGVTIAGGTRLKLHSPMHATLDGGSASFRVPANATGFTVELPDRSRIVDLGTAFRVDVSTNNRIRLEVTEGRVEWRRGGHGPSIVSVDEVARIGADGSIFITPAPKPLPDVRVLASSEEAVGDGRRHAYYLIDGSGLNDEAHTADDPNRSLWNSAAGDHDPRLVFEFPEPVALDHVRIWNYNIADPTFLGRCVARLDVWVSDTGVGSPDSAPDHWRRIVDDAPLSLAPGHNAYDTPDRIDLLGVTARFVRFDDMQRVGTTPDPYGVEVGLGEIRFMGAPAATTTTEDPTPAED